MPIFRKEDQKNSSNLFEFFLNETVKMITVSTEFLLNKAIAIVTDHVNEFIRNRSSINKLKLNQKQTIVRKTTSIGDSIGYSINEKRSIMNKEIDTTKHTAIIGSTGSGKTVCMNLLMENALQKGQAVIYFDPKNSAENLEKFKLRCKLYGKEYFIFNDTDFEASSFNPLLGASHGDVANIIMNAITWSEPFYKNECEDALLDSLSKIYERNEDLTFTNLLSNLQIHPNKNNIKTLLNITKMLNNSKFGLLINGSRPQTFTKLRESDCCLYIGISSMGIGSLGNFLNKVFFGGLLNHAKVTLDNKADYSPISIFFDELSSTIHEGFIDLQNKCREAKMEITYATQGPSDFEKISPSLSNQIFENTNNIFLFNQIVPLHTEYFSRMFGTIRSRKSTHVTHHDLIQSAGTTRDTEEFIVHGNVIKNLKIGQCIFFQRSPKKISLLNIKFDNGKDKMEQLMIKRSYSLNKPESERKTKISSSGLLFGSED